MKLTDPIPASKNPRHRLYTNEEIMDMALKSPSHPLNWPITHFYFEDKNSPQYLRKIEYDWYNELIQYPDVVEKFLSIFDEGRLIKFHSTLGRLVRNKYQLWSRSWEPEIDENGVDRSSNHPDQISQNIIKSVWKRLHKGKMNNE